jgi:hypothetical protein
MPFNVLVALISSNASSIAYFCACRHHPVHARHRAGEQPKPTR